VLAVVKSTILILSALFPIVNPLGSTPIFLGLTREASSAERPALSRRVAINSALLLIGSLFTGTHVLSFFGISPPVVHVGSGLIVISTGWTTLKWKPEANAGHRVPRAQPDPRMCSRRPFIRLRCPRRGPGIHFRGHHAGGHGDGRDHGALIVPAGVNRRADPVERGQRAAEFTAGGDSVEPPVPNQCVGRASNSASTGNPRQVAG
jgi:hypothetical protein